MCEANNHEPKLLEAKALAPARLAGSLVAHVEMPTQRYTSWPLSWWHRRGISGPSLLVRLQMKLKAAGRPASQPLLPLRKDSHHVRTPRAAAVMESARLQCVDKLENATGGEHYADAGGCVHLQTAGLAIACSCSGQRREHTQILQQPIMQEMSSHRWNHVLTSKQ